MGHEGWTGEATRVRLAGTSNLRDLGGTPVADGRTVLPRRIYRSEALVRPGTTDLCAIWDPARADGYAALGVRTVLDLRSAREAGRVASAWPEATGADLVALPIADGLEGDTDYVREIREGRRTRFTVEDMAAYYALVLRRRAGLFGEALRLLADPARLPVLVHCAAGKDRTGLLVALLLEALGAPRAVVVADYALTGVLRPNRVLAYAHWFESSDVDLAEIATLFDAPGPAMAVALAGLDAGHGSVAGYLERECGVTRSDVESLRTHLLTPS